MSGQRGGGILRRTLTAFQQLLGLALFTRQFSLPLLLAEICLHHAGDRLPATATTTAATTTVAAAAAT